MKIFKKEKQVAALALEYLHAASACVSAGQAAVLAYLNGALDESATAQKEASDLESTADSLRRSIGDLLFSGAYLPLIRGDIFSVIDMLDKVPNAAEACSSFFISEKPQVPEQFKSAFVEVTTGSFGAMRPLEKAVKGLFKPKGDIDKVRAHAQEVGDEESRVDDLEWALKVALFESKEIDLSHQQHLRVALNRIVHLSDVAEDAADRLEMVAMKSIL